MFMLWFRLVVHCLIITLSNHRARTHALPAAALNTLNMFRRAALYRAVLYTVHCTPDCTVVTPRGNRRCVRGSSDTTGTTDHWCTLGAGLCQLRCGDTGTSTGQLLATGHFTLHLALTGFCAQLTSGPWQPPEIVDMIVTDIPDICFIAETFATN